MLRKIIERKMPKTVKYLVLGLLIFGVLASSGCVESPNRDVETVSPSDMVVSEPDLSRAEDRFSVDVVSPMDFARAEVTSLSDVGTGTGIVVSGQGRVRLTPDLAVFTVGVITTGKTSQEAISENADTMGSVISSLKSAGVDEKDIKTQTVNVRPEFDYGTRDEKRELPIIIGYRAENRVSVTIRDIAKTGEVMDAATSAGANQLYGLSFTVSDETSKALRAEVLKVAVLDATDKAQAIADALGVERISPIRVVESGGYAPPIFRYDVAALEEGAVPTPVSPGEVEVTASVTVTFDF